MEQYAKDNAYFYPDKNGAEGLEQLRRDDYLMDYKIYRCPSKCTEYYDKVKLNEKNLGYHYTGGGKYSWRNTCPLAWDKIENHGRKKEYGAPFSYLLKNYGNVLLANGSVIHYEGEAWKKFCEENDLSKK